MKKNNICKYYNRIAVWTVGINVIWILVCLLSKRLDTTDYRYLSIHPVPPQDYPSIPLNGLVCLTTSLTLITDISLFIFWLVNEI